MEKVFVVEKMISFKYDCRDVDSVFKTRESAEKYIQSLKNKLSDDLYYFVVDGKKVCRYRAFEHNLQE